MSNSLAGKSVLITGASGFIGSHLVRRALAEGGKVHIVARDGSNLWRIKDVADDIRIHRADLRDADDIFNCVQESKPEYVFNMAAYGVDPKYNDYLVAASTNTIGLINILRAMIRCGCKKIVNMGTCMEYGDKYEIIAEDCFLEPFNIYGSTKAAATLIAHQIASENDIDIVTLRAFSIFGEYVDSCKLFPHIILSILKNKQVHLTGCEQYRDYCYVQNIIDGIMISALNDTVRNEIFNIGSGEIYPLKYYVDKIYSKMNAPGKPSYGAVPYRAREAWKPQPDISKIKKVLKWEPRVGLDEGLDITIKWYADNMDLFD